LLKQELPEKHKGVIIIGEEQVKRIEEIIDDCQKTLEPLKSFILPGGGKDWGLSPSVQNGMQEGRAGGPSAIQARGNQ